MQRLSLISGHASSASFVHREGHVFFSEDKNYSLFEMVWHAETQFRKAASQPR